jgi:hypothetical protein
MDFHEIATSGERDGSQAIMHDMMDLQPQVDTYSTSSAIQQENPQVHTIMLNGQPALFIPASSSNLICQMLMNPSNSNQIYEIMQSSNNNQLQLNPNDLASLMTAANQQYNENPYNLGKEIIRLGSKKPESQ